MFAPFSVRGSVPILRIVNHGCETFHATEASKGFRLFLCHRSRFWSSACCDSTEAGKCLVFDDSYEHEVWNKTEGERVLLLFDLWHPDLVEEVRPASTHPLWRSVYGLFVTL